MDVALPESDGTPARLAANRRRPARPRLAELHQFDLCLGHLFAFLSRRADRVKILTWDRGGFVLHQKRLERGRFRWPALEAGAQHARFNAGQLAMLLDDVDLARARSSRVREPPSIAT
jgi:transposase